MMNKKLFLISSLSLIVILIIYFGINRGTGDDINNSKITLFYSENCPHCVKVEEFLTANNVAANIVFENKLIDNNSRNIAELKDRAKQCGLVDNIGIPFLWDGENTKCILGDEDVINFFQSKLTPNPQINLK